MQLVPEQQEISRIIQSVFTTFVDSNCEIRPHFHLTGPSGSGKSYLVEKLAAKNEAAYFEINAAQLTKEGFSGNSLSKAMRPLINSWDRPTIIFVDEFDKLLDQNGGSQEHTLGVQDEFLKVLESDFTAIFTDYGKYQNYEARKTLFVFGGAYGGKENLDLEGLRALGMRTEFTGRVGLVFNTQKISLDSMLSLVPKARLLAEYQKIRPEVKLAEVIKFVRSEVTKAYKTSTVGLRLINTLIHMYYLQPKKA